MSFITDLALDIGDSVLDHYGVLLQTQLLLLQVGALLLQETHFVVVLLLHFPEILLQVVNVFQDFFQDVVQAFCALVLEGGALRPQKLRVLFIIVQSLDRVLDVELHSQSSSLTSIYWIRCLMGMFVALNYEESPLAIALFYSILSQL